MTVLNDNYIEKYRIKMKFKHTNSSPSIRRTIDINYGEIKKKTQSHGRNANCCIFSLSVKSNTLTSFLNF